MNQKSGWIAPSTRAWWREAHKKKFSMFDFFHGYFYSRWPYFYIAMGTGRHPLARRLAPVLNWVGQLIVGTAGAQQKQAVNFEDTYHGKVVPLRAARQLVSIKQDINLGDLEHIIPYRLAREIVMQNPEHIAVLDCPCRASRENPCLPLDVCLIIGEPFASFILEHHPGRSRAVTSEEAQEILAAEDARGHVHHAFFKDAMLGRFYAICNCCSCCCGAMLAQQTGTPMLASSGFVAQVDTDVCRGCGGCEKVCQFKAVQVVERKAVVDQAKCMGCGICVGQCQSGGIGLERAPERGIPLEIEDLMLKSLQIAVQ
jgi:ferredoxin